MLLQIISLLFMYSWVTFHWVYIYIYYTLPERRLLYLVQNSNMAGAHVTYFPIFQLWRISWCIIRFIFRGVCKTDQVTSEVTLKVNSEVKWSLTLGTILHVSANSDLSLSHRISSHEYWQWTEYFPCSFSSRLKKLGRNFIFFFAQIRKIATVQFPCWPQQANWTASFNSD